MAQLLKVDLATRTEDEANRILKALDIKEIKAVPATLKTKDRAAVPGTKKQTVEEQLEKWLLIKLEDEVDAQEVHRAKIEAKKKRLSLT